MEEIYNIQNTYRWSILIECMIQIKKIRTNYVWYPLKKSWQNPTSTSWVKGFAFLTGKNAARNLPKSLNFELRFRFSYPQTFIEAQPKNIHGNNSCFNFFSKIILLINPYAYKTKVRKTIFYWKKFYFRIFRTFYTTGKIICK